MNSSIFREEDRDLKRKRALAKVYRLLIRLADEAEDQAVIAHSVSERKTELEILTPVNNLRQGVLPLFVSGVSDVITEQPNSAL